MPVETRMWIAGRKRCRGRKPARDRGQRRGRAGNGHEVSTLSSRLPEASAATVARGNDQAIPLEWWGYGATMTGWMLCLPIEMAAPERVRVPRAWLGAT